MSRFGAARGEPDYDRFRTGLTYREVRTMMSDRRWRRRRGVLGFWHELKLQLWYQMTGGAFLLVVLVAGCGSVSELALDSGAGEDARGVESSSPDAPPQIVDADASPALPACAWDTHAPHEATECPARPGLWSCHYLDSGGRPDGYLTGCQERGKECVYPCP